LKKPFLKSLLHHPSFLSFRHKFLTGKLKAFAINHVSKLECIKDRNALLQAQIQKESWEALKKVYSENEEIKEKLKREQQITQFYREDVAMPLASQFPNY